VGFGRSPRSGSKRFPRGSHALRVEGATPKSETEGRWLESTPPRRSIDRLISLATFGLAGNRVTVEKVRIATTGVTFVFGGRSEMVPWQELVPSKWQLGKGYVVLKTKDGTPPRGGAWAVDRMQAMAILTHPNWGFPEYSRSVIPKWLA
jgi:hypothetical protein